MPADASRLPFGTTGWWFSEHFALRGTGLPLKELTEAMVPGADDDSGVAARHRLTPVETTVPDLVDGERSAADIGDVHGDGQEALASRGWLAEHRLTPAGRRVEMASVKVDEGPIGFGASFPDGTRQPILTFLGEFLSCVTMSDFALTPRGRSHRASPSTGWSSRTKTRGHRHATSPGLRRRPIPDPSGVSGDLPAATPSAPCGFRAKSTLGDRDA